MKGLVVVLILSFWAVKPLFEPGFFPIHDDTQVVRVFEMGQALSDGHFPVRWVKDLGYGYGYPLFNFYAPLPYYIGGLANVLGLDVLISTKIMMALAIILSGIFMYFLAREFWGEVGGAISGLFYVYAPYHAIDIYVRGAVGEFWAMAFIPLVFYGLWKVHQEQKWKWVVVGGLGYAGIITSHNLTAMMVTPFIIIATLLLSYIAYRNKNLSSIIYHLSSIILGLGFSAFYWVPALLEVPYTNVLSQVGGGADFRDHFVCWPQLWDSPWGFGGSAPGCLDGMSFKIGKLHILVSLLASIISFCFWKKDRLRSSIVSLSIIYYLLSIIMMLEPSRFVWEAVYPMTFIQYPWRFLVLTSFSSSFLAGGLVWFLSYFNTRSYYSKAGAIGLIFFLLFFNIKLFQPQTIFPVTTEDYVNENYIKWITSKTSDEYMPKDFAKPLSRDDIVKDRVSAKNISINKTDKLQFTVENDKEETLLINIAPFPSWRASLDGREVDYRVSNRGIEVVVPKGKHALNIIFKSTSIQVLANGVSAISGFIILGGILLRKKK